MASLNGKEILIVDDAEDVRKLVTKVLENDGAVVGQAAFAEDGLAAAEVARPHLIILDLNFAGMNGFDFLARRREIPELTAVPVIVLSAVNDKEGVTRAISMGANDYVIKPFRATQILQKVRKHLAVSSYLDFRFGKGEGPLVEVTIKGEIAHYSEFGFQLESSVKFERDQPVSVSSDVFNNVPLAEVLLKTSNVQSVYVASSRYANSILFTGVGEAMVKKIKKAMGA